MSGVSSTATGATPTSTSTQKQSMLPAQGILRSDIRIPSPHLHWNPSLNNITPVVDQFDEIHHRETAIYQHPGFHETDMHPPDPVSSTLLTIAEDPQSPSANMEPTHRRCCSNCTHSRTLQIEPSTSELLHCSHRLGSTSSDSSVQEDFYSEDQIQERLHRQQHQRKLTNDILEHPLIRSTSVHKVSQDTNAARMALEYDPRHRSQQAVICDADSPTSIYSPDFMPPGAFGVGGETPELDRMNGFDYPPNNGANARKKDHMEQHVRFDVNQSDVEGISTGEENDAASVLSEYLEPQKFDPTASMEIPIKLDYGSKKQMAEPSAQHQENTFEQQGKPSLGQRRGLLPSALPETFQKLAPVQGGTSHDDDSDCGPPTPPKDAPPRNIEQTPSPPDSVQTRPRSNSNRAAGKNQRKNSEYSVFPPRYQYPTPEQTKPVRDLPESVQQLRNGQNPVHTRNQSSGSHQIGSNDSMHNRVNSSYSNIISPRQVLDANGNPTQHTFHRSSADENSKPKPPFESPRPPPQPPSRVNARHGTPRTPSHTHARSNSSGIQHDPQTPAQSHTPWRPHFNFSVFDNSMSPATPGNDLRVQIQQMQKQLKMQQMQLEKIQQSGVDLPLVSPKSAADGQNGQSLRQYKSHADLRDARSQGQGRGSEESDPSDIPQTEPRRGSRSGSVSRLRSLSPSKIRSRRKPSPPKIQHLGPAPLNVVHEKDSHAAPLSIDSNLANNGRISPVKTGKNDEPKSASEVSPSHVVNEYQTPETPGWTASNATNSQKNAAFRSVSTPSNRKGCLDGVAEDKVTNSTRRDSEKEVNQAKTPKGSALKGWGSKIMKSMQDLTDRKASVNVPINPFQSRLSPYGPHRAPVSLDPPTQARLYADLDLLICIAANQFIIQQHKARRISVDAFSKLLNTWMTKSRPVVPQFMFDQLTQRDLIAAHARSFRFHGESARSSSALNNNLNTWKILAEEMGFRTYFLPDSVVRRHLNDTIRVLEMLGATPQTFGSFQEIQNGALGIMKKAQEREKRVDDAPAGLSSDFIAIDDDSDR